MKTNRAEPCFLAMAEIACRHSPCLLHASSRAPRWNAPLADLADHRRAPSPRACASFLLAAGWRIQPKRLTLTRWLECGSPPLVRTTEPWTGARIHVVTVTMLASDTAAEPRRSADRASPRRPAPQMQRQRQPRCCSSQRLAAFRAVKSASLRLSRGGVRAGAR